MITFARVDNRLIHGQVIEGWLPLLDVQRLLVADDLAAGNTLTRTAMLLAVPPDLIAEILPMARVDFAQEANRPEPTLLLVRDPSNALAAFAAGLVTPVLNLGNVHFEPGREPVTPSLHLSSAEITQLLDLEARGQPLDLRALPHEKPQSLRALADRLPSRAGTPA